MSRPSRAGLALGLLLLAAPALAADFLDAYKSGLKALKQQSWSAAAESFRKAIAGRAEEKEKLPVRFFFDPYVPHYYLGVALAGSGDCPGALAAWAESERQKVILGLDLHKRLAADRGACEDRLAQASRLDDARRQAQERVTRASEAGRQAQAALPAADEAENEEIAALRPRLDDALGRLTEARQAVDSAAGDAETLRQAGETAAEAERQLRDLRQEAERLTAAHQEAQTSASQGLAAAVQAARKVLAGVPSLAVYPPELARRKGELESEIGDVEALPPTARPAEIAAAQADLEAAATRLRKAAAGPPDRLARAAAAFLRGEPAQTVSLLDSIAFADSRINAQAFLLRAAARHHLYLEGGETSSSLLAAAQADVRACHAADPARSPSPRVFSPRFRDFFRETTQDATP